MEARVLQNLVRVIMALRKTRCVIRVRLWRARHATKTIAKFLYDNRFYAPIIKFKNCVRAALHAR